MSKTRDKNHSESFYCLQTKQMGRKCTNTDTQSRIETPPRLLLTASFLDERELSNHLKKKKAPSQLLHTLAQTR